MKKLAYLLILLSLAVTLHAEDARRFFELGVGADVNVANNYFGWSDFFNPEKTLKLDLNDFADGLADGGLKLGAGLGGDVHLALNIPKKFGLGFYTDVSGYAFSSLPGSIFDLLASGNELDKTYSGTAEMSGDVYLEAGCFFSSHIGSITFRVEPVYFMPVIHVGDPDVTYSMRMNSDGTVQATGTAVVPVYSATSLEDTSNIDVAALQSDLLSSGGLDLSLSAEYPLLRVLTVGARIRSIPIIPGRLAYRSLYTTDFTFSMANMLQSYDADSDLYTSDTTSDTVYDKDEATVYRPFRIGATAEYKPFGNRLVSVCPNIDIVYYNSVYVDCGVQANLNLGNFLILSFGSNYEDRVWRESAALVLNLRVLELDAGIASTSQDFIQSFQVSGVQLVLGVRMGF